MNEGERADTGGGTLTQAVLVYALFHRTKEDVQGQVLNVPIALQVLVQPLWDRQHPLRQH